MRLRFLLASFLMLAGAALAAPANAQLVSAANPESVASALRAQGYQAELTKDSDGDPMIRSGTGGTKFIILFFGCTANSNCATIQFYAGYSDVQVTHQRVNEWNKTRRFGRAYIDNEGDPVVEMDLDLDDGGMSRALFEDNVEFWTSVVDGYRRFLIEKEGTN